MKKYNEAYDEFMREYLTRALLESKGSINAMSRITGINRTHIYKMCKKAGVEINRVAPGRKSTFAHTGNAAWQELGA